MELEEIALETESFSMNKENEKIKKNYNFECSHKEGFSLEGTPSKKKPETTQEESGETKQETNNIPNQQMPFMFNPMMMQSMPQMPGMNQNPKGPMIYYLPVYYDPSNMSKDMKGQTRPMFYPPMMPPMYPTNMSRETSNK